MGKHKNMVNPDPIIKKDYKYEKRKKLRAEERQQQRQLVQQERKKKEEMMMIEHEVQQQIQNQLLKSAAKNKHKSINKLPKGLIGNGKKAQKKTNSSTMSNSNKEILQLQINEDFDHYKYHYEQMPGETEIVRWRQQTKKDQIDRQVRSEIRSMFGEKEEVVDADQEQKRKDNMDIQYSNPYLLVKAKQPQKQIVINGEHPHLFTQQSLSVKNILHEEGDVRKSVIESYCDYIHIENKQETTIEDFRKMVISHMATHEQRCRSEPTTSKGFTNAKSLILCPYFGDGRTIIELLLAHYPSYEVLNSQKLEQVDDESDFFRLGITINDKKQTIKFFSNFNVSNLIIASPVGLKAIVGADGQSNRDYSFLSSVQILYIDRASTIYMQNWDHLIQVVKNMNMMPTPDSICNDFSNFRPLVPELKGKLYRQSIVFSQFNVPEINGLKHVHFHNWQGCITTKICYEAPQYSQKIKNLEKQFYKLELNEPKDDIEMRFQFFKRKFWDQLHNTDSMDKVVIFVRSYFEFVKLKDFMIRANASAQFISEHTQKPKVQSRVAHFNAGKQRILLLTERAYFYNVCQIKKLQHLYMYSLPRNAYIFNELLGETTKQDSYSKNKIVAIYTKYDVMALERIVGSRKAQEMVRQFCSNVSFIL